MESKTLSVCLIVKNEEKLLGNCLKSVSSIADEIIVVDTGSTDKSIEIAKSYFAKVINHPWIDDFSDARNKSLEYATKDFILVLDADEFISEADGLAIKNIINKYGDYDCFLMKVLNIVNNVSQGPVSVLRLFKNNPEFRFEGKIHEQIMPSIKKHCKNLKIASSNIRILHYGYDYEICDMNKKSKRNLDLLNSIKDEDKDGYYYYSLGNEYMKLNELEKSINIYIKGFDLAKKEGMKDIYIPYLCSNLIKSFYTDKRYMECINIADECEKYFKDFKDLYLFKFLSYLKCGYYSQSKIFLKKYIETKNGNNDYPLINIKTVLDVDIKDFVKFIDSKICNNKKDLLSVIIMVDKKDDNVSDSILSVNEIADEVIVLSSKEINIDKEKIANLGAKIIEVNSSDKKEIFMVGSQYATKNFTLLMKPLEVLPSHLLKKFSQLLEKTNSKYFDIQVLDKKTNIYTNEFRIYKNSNALKKIDDFNDYIAFIQSQEIKQSGLFLEKTYVKEYKSLQNYILGT